MVQKDSNSVVEQLSKQPWYEGDKASDVGESTEAAVIASAHKQEGQMEPKQPSAATGGSQHRSRLGLLPKTISHTKFKKAVCKNCGSGDHSAKDCLERPRKAAGKVKRHRLVETAVRDIPSDIHTSGTIDKASPSSGAVKAPEAYEAKRDHWKEYSTEEYKKVIDNFGKKQNAISEAVKKKVHIEMTEASENGSYDPYSRTTVQSYRSREDRPDYLK